MKNDDGLSCNLIVLDFIICVIWTAATLYEKFNIGIFAGILLGILAAVLLIILMMLDYIGVIIRIAMGVVWGIFIYKIITIFVNMDLSGKIVMLIFSIGFAELLHWASYWQLYGSDTASPQKAKMHHKQSADNNYSQSYVYVNEHNKMIEEINHFENEYQTAVKLQETIDKQVVDLCSRFKIEKLYDEYMSFRLVADQQWRVLENARRELYMTDNAFYRQQKLYYAKSCLDALFKLQVGIGDSYMYYRDYYDTQSWNTDSENLKNQRDDIDESLFNGCEDKTSFVKRYRELMKMYHPDNINGGDEAMTIKIKNTYDYLKDQFAQ